MAVHQPLRGRLVFLAVALLAILGAAGFASRSHAQAPARLPTDLDLVPRDAAAFVHMRTADLWKSEWLGDIRRLVDRAGPEYVQAFLKKFAPDLSTVDRITFVMLAPRTLNEPFPSGDPEGMSALLIISTTRPYDRLKVIESLGPREKVYKRNLYYFNEDMWSGLALLDDRTFVFGSEDALVSFFDSARNRGADGPLQTALLEAAGKHHVVVGLNPQLLAKEEGARFMPPPLLKLLEAQCGTFTLDLEKEIRLLVRFDYSKADEAKAGEKALKDTLELARGGLALPIQELEARLKKPPERGGLEELPENFGMLLGLGMLREIDALLKDARVQPQGSSVRLPINYKGLESSNMLVVSLAAITTLGKRVNATFATVGSRLGGDPNAKDPNEEHLKKLADALEKYHKDKGTYPPVAIFDKDGRPLLSWRVALLPYLGQEPLYKEFKLDEPWDSLHNKKVLKKLPDVLKAPDHWDRFKTVDLVVTGPGTPFSGKTGVKKTDVPAAAVLVMSATGDRAVYWSKPVDLAYADDKPLPDLFGKYGYGSVHVLQANGKYRSLRKGEIDDKALRDLIKGKEPKK